MSSSQRRFANLELGMAPVARRRRLFGALTVGLPTLLAALAGALDSHRFPGGALIEPSSVFPTWWRVGLLAGLVVSAVSLTMWTVYRRMGAPRATKRGSAVVSDDELVLFVDGQPQTFPRSRIVNVFVDRMAVGVTLDDGRTLALSTPDETTRGRIRDALAIDPVTSRAVVPVGGAARAFTPVNMLTWWLFVVMLPLVVMTAGSVADDLTRGALTVLPHFVAMAAATTALWAALRRREVVVGSDGVRLKGTFFDTFVPHDAIERVVRFSDDKVVVHHSGGKKLRLPPAPGNASLKTCIEVARRVPREVAPEVEGLARGDRDETAWREALAALAEDGSYRTGALRIEDVEATLGDPGARPDARVAAAMTLRDQPEGRERIRVAVETTADADLQAALEAAAEGEVAGRVLRKAQKRFDARKKR
ncbi:MAG: hypothetical protein RIF41_41175 [Polyangiaceae bacterium]